MNNDVEVEGRPRPLSTGLWTLFSWLRRDDRSESNESLSSAGSDRTVASFAFLAPTHYETATKPLVLPPPGPPTDSYKKRVHDRNLRRHHDRDLTLHSKYGLFKSEGTSNYDAFSLPPVRRINAEPVNRWDRERRAISECYQRRLAHVPGKRRAPLPPVSVSVAGPSASLPRRNTRKRPAPQPPGRLSEKNKENLKNVKINNIALQMNPNTYQDKPKLRSNDVTMGCKSEKYSKKEEEKNLKDSKIKSEKSFLKQIFDGKKRNSSVDTASVKILPSISELDKQAAEIIQTSKLKATEQNNNVIAEMLGSQNLNQGESWFCVLCLRKYNSSVVTCVYCISKQKGYSSETSRATTGAACKASNSYTQTGNELQVLPASNRIHESKDKQKLKEMLKEMKDSLPKRPKHDVNNKAETKTYVENKTETETYVEPKIFGTNSYSTETPTLRVGSTAQTDKKTSSACQPSTSNIIKSDAEPMTSKHKSYAASTQTALVAQVISAYKKSVNNNNLNLIKPITENDRAVQAPVTNVEIRVKESENQNPKDSIEPLQDNVLNTPLKISSLLNPMYEPKNPILDKLQLTKSARQPETKNTSPRSYEINQDKLYRISQATTVPSLSTNEIVVPSLSKINVSSGYVDKTENEHNKNNMEKRAKEEMERKDTSPVKTTEAKRVLESNKPKANISKLPSPAKEKDMTQDQHSRRRDLINQLEKSIAKGDERAAAEAAAKLAQLRLSCSVLSFSSQILSQPSTSSTNNVEIKVSKVKPNAVISYIKNESHEKVSSSLIQVRSPPIVPVSNAMPNTVIVQNKAASSSVTKAESTKEISVIKNKDADNTQRTKPETKKTTSNKTDNNIITIAVLVEDREATRGPVHLRINRQACIRDLRREAETSLGVAAHLQRWIVGRALCANDTTSIASLAGPDFSAPFYLCVVESETKVELNSEKTKVTESNDANNEQKKPGNVYTELVQLEQQALVPNAENFECSVCIEQCLPGQGVVLRECVHVFCKECLSDVVRHCEEPDVPCPAMGCRGMLQEREIRALVSPQDYERWLARGLAAAESGTRNAFHCRTRDCKGWALCEPGVQRFPCPVCKSINCVPCQAIHNGETCEQHRAKLKEAANKSNSTSETDEGTRTLLNSLISKGEALECPECSAIITKKWGCDWVKCSACKTEICWVTRGRRWGPGGKGDTSGGCRCGVDGKRCHPSCGYCH